LRLKRERHLVAASQGKSSASRISGQKLCLQLFFVSKQKAIANQLSLVPEGRTRIFTEKRIKTRDSAVSEVIQPGASIFTEAKSETRLQMIAETNRQ